MWWLAMAASATVPLPSYERELGIGRWLEVEQRFEQACRRDPRSGSYLECDDDALRAVIAHADAFQDAVVRTAGLEYQAGLAFVLLGDKRRAIQRYRAAVALDRDVTEAWYDLGEMLLASGDLEGADAAFQEVVRLQADALDQYSGVWRLAEVDAHRGDAAAFEEHMREALRRGFSFRAHQVGSLPNWRGFYHNEKLRPSIEKLITVYGDETIIEELAQPPGAN